jgi:hypothetical protein
LARRWLKCTLPRIEAFGPGEVGGHGKAMLLAGHPVHDVLSHVADVDCCV